MSSSPFKGRREDFRLVTGQGRYTADWNFPGLAFAQFLRSDRAHAEIAAIDTAAAAALPGVLCVLTGADVVKAGFKSPQPLSHMKGRGGAALKIPHRPALAHERVRFVGEPVALVVAESDAIAQDGVERIAVDYRNLPAAVTAGDARAPGAPQLYSDIPGNLAMEYDYGDAAATEAAFAKAAHVVRLSLDAQRISGNPMEPKACLAVYNAETDTADIYCPTQGMAGIQADLAYVTGMPKERVRIHAKDVGGAFGVRNELYPEFAAVFLAARTLGRPVKWLGTRAESILSDHHGRGALMTGTLALDAAGNFLAVRAEWLVGLGAYCSNAGPFINTAAAPTGMAASAYRTPAISGTNRLAFTNATPVTAYRGAGRPNVAYLMERLVDEAARVTGIDRIELRRRNLLVKKDFPYKTPVGSVYDSGDPPGLLAIALKESDWKGFARRRRESAKRGKLRGIGCATFIEPSGGVGQEEIAIRFDAKGLANVFTLAGPSGQGHETAFPDVVAEILGLASDKIALRYSDPDGPPLVGTGSFGSRSLISHGAAMAVGAREIIRKGTELAAQHLEVAATDIVFEGGTYRVPGTDLAVSLEQLVLKHAGDKEHPLDVVAKIATAAAYPGGAHVAEVEIDRATGVLDIVRYVAADDCGRIINHTLVEGQLIGGVVQGIGQLIGEHCVYDDDGQLLTGTFMDYVMPRADCVPDFSLHDHSIPSPANPLGAKGAGEAGTTGAIPAIANAVIDALSPLGIYHLDTPFTPARLWAAMQEVDQKQR